MACTLHLNVTFSKFAFGFLAGVLFTYGVFFLIYPNALSEDYVVDRDGRLREQYDPALQPGTPRRKTADIEKIQFNLVYAARQKEKKGFDLQIRDRTIHESDDKADLKSPPSFDKERLKSDMARVMNLVKDEVRILCLIVTNSTQHTNKAIHIEQTWAKRCNMHLFVSDKEDERFPVMRVSNKEGRVHIWDKVHHAFKHVYENLLDQFDWVLKADDDTYVIMENLRFLLLSHKPQDPIFFGCKFKPFVAQGYMSGGAGYVLSQEAVRRLVESKCNGKYLDSEDVQMGMCLDRAKVVAGDSRDSENRHRFLPLTPLQHLLEGGVSEKAWVWSYYYYPVKSGTDCCSDFAISFHYVEPRIMYLLDFYLYKSHAFGIESRLLTHLHTSPNELTNEELLQAARELSSTLRGVDDAVFNDNGQLQTQHTFPPAYNLLPS